MQPKPRQVHILRKACDVETSQNQPEPNLMLGPDDRLCSGAEELHQALVTEGPNHKGIVTRWVTLRKVTPIESSMQTSVVRYLLVNCFRSAETIC